MKNNLGVTYVYEFILSIKMMCFFTFSLSYAPWLIEIKKAPYSEPFFEVIVRVYCSVKFTGTL